MSKIRVIVIEDHDLTRVGIRATLQQDQEIEFVGEAANALDGLALSNSLQPDVVIVDIGLPGTDGIELTREIKSIALLHSVRTKVLILTLNSSLEAALAAFAAGADSYCMKDTTYNNLLEAIHVTHNGNTWIDSTVARIILQQNQYAIGKPLSGAARFVSQTLDDDSDLDIVHIDPLTERELEVIGLIVRGCSNVEISKNLVITVGTVKSHVRNILNKLCAEDRTQAAVHALRYGIVTWNRPTYTSK